MHALSERKGVILFSLQKIDKIRVRVRQPTVAEVDDSDDAFDGIVEVKNVDG